jgi:hypothetical protein
VWPCLSVCKDSKATVWTLACPYSKHHWNVRLRKGTLGRPMACKPTYVGQPSRERMGLKSFAEYQIALFQEPGKILDDDL